MVYGREKLVPDEYLDDFLNCLGYGWDCGWSAKKIAEEMGFGEEGDTSFYGKLKPCHVYYFVQVYGKEWGMEPRVKHKKKADKLENAVVYKVPISATMPFAVSNWLRNNGFLIE